jgi:hypothetical protein
MTNARTIELERLKYGLQQMVSKEFNAGANIADIEGKILIQIRGWVWGEHTESEYRTFKYPADWWQAFKERWFPAWLIERYPVRYHTERIEVRWTYKAYPSFMDVTPPGLTKVRIPIIEQPEYFIGDRPCQRQS